MMDFKLEKVKSQPGAHFVRSCYWSIQIWAFLKALFWFPLTFLVVSYIELKEIFF